MKNQWRCCWLNRRGHEKPMKMLLIKSKRKWRSRDEDFLRSPTPGHRATWRYHRHAGSIKSAVKTDFMIAAYCSILQHIAAYCSILQHIAAYCSILQHIAAYCSILQHIAAYCSILQHIAAYFDMEWHGHRWPYRAPGMLTYSLRLLHHFVPTRSDSDQTLPGELGVAVSSVSWQPWCHWCTLRRIPGHQASRLQNFVCKKHRFLCKFGSNLFKAVHLVQRESTENDTPFTQDHSRLSIHCRDSSNKEDFPSSKFELGSLPSEFAPTMHSVAFPLPLARRAFSRFWLSFRLPILWTQILRDLRDQIFNMIQQTWRNFNYARVCPYYRNTYRNTMPLHQRSWNRPASPWSPSLKNQPCFNLQGGVLPHGWKTCMKHL